MNKLNLNVLQDYRLGAPVSDEMGQHWMTEAEQGVGPERGADVPRAVPVLQPDLPQRQRHTVRPTRPPTSALDVMFCSDLSGRCELHHWDRSLMYN